MNPLRFKLLVAWNIVLSTALVLVVLGVVVSAAQAANDPPVKVYTATLDHQSGIAGTGTEMDKVINSTDYQTILSVPVSFAGQTHEHYCVVLASANVVNPATGGNTGYRYDFTVGVNGTYSGWARMVLEMSDNPSHDDPNYVPVTTQRMFGPHSAAGHTFTFVARKQAASNPNMTIDNASMTVICFKKLQTLAAIAPDIEAPQEIAPNDK